MKHVHQGYVYIWVIWLLKNAEIYLTGIHVCNVMTIPCLCSVMMSRETGLITVEAFPSLSCLG